MTQRHARYLAQYPQRIHRKRLKRRRLSQRGKATKRNHGRYFRKVFQEYMATHPRSSASKKRGIIDRVKSVFKPTV